jgi:hypothetical protein
VGLFLELGNPDVIILQVSIVHLVPIEELQKVHLYLLRCHTIYRIVPETSWNFNGWPSNHDMGNPKMTKEPPGNTESPSEKGPRTDTLDLA